MRSTVLILVAALAVSAAPAVAKDSAYRGAEPLSDTMLDDICAKALPSFARNARLLTDAQARLDLQQVGANSRIAMDNWWSQTGAALIYDNLIASPPLR